LGDTIEIPELILKSKPERLKALSYLAALI
jgi:hypothetical protein